MRYYSITGTVHGSIIYASSKDDARNLFNKVYPGESILSIRLTSDSLSLISLINSLDYE